MKTITKDKKQKEKNTSSIDKTQIQIALELWETAKKRKYKEIQWEDVELMFNMFNVFLSGKSPKKSVQVDSIFDPDMASLMALMAKI